jgi:hypothetical protein
MQLMGVFDGTKECVLIKDAGCWNYNFISI